MAAIAESAIFHSNRQAMYSETTPKKMINARNAFSVIVRPPRRTHGGNTYVLSRNASRGSKFVLNLRLYFWCLFSNLKANALTRISIQRLNLGARGRNPIVFQNRSRLIDGQICGWNFPCNTSFKINPEIQSTVV